MADLQNYSVVKSGNTYIIQAQITDSNTGAVLNDFTGANEIVFPTVWGTLTAAQQQKMIDMLAHELIYMKAGLA